ncbi:hypothetical protein Ae201684P_015988 [Aphanomyces euteiches]|uniref:Glycine zipper domain-containing protein n=1 Tax=Aphanomyces euteiches TaxID=100861 RepID=A0A6G0W9U9_9STRA|nr:hypothetical protein Ae201684_017983 [Aphanomyces euteiches]KAH9074090.1 hypothetical protein Ae201684P_015988 [Aphanomyces euteiches]
MRPLLLAAIATTCALAWRHDRPTDSIAVEDAVYAARADQINRMLVQKHTVELSQKEKAGIKYGRWGGKAVGGGAGMAVGTLTGIAVGTMAGGPVGAVAGATAGGVAGRLGGELAGKKFLPRLGAKVGRFFANRDAAKGPQILKTLTERNPELKAISDKGSRISRNKPIPLMQRIIRSNSAASSVSYEKGPKPKWGMENKPINVDLSQILPARRIAKRCSSPRISRRNDHEEPS